MLDLILSRILASQWLVIAIVSALQLDDVVLGGGNAKQLANLSKGCRAGDNNNAFLGGFRRWDERRKVESMEPNSKPKSCEIDKAADHQPTAGATRRGKRQPRKDQDR